MNILSKEDTAKWILSCGDLFVHLDPRSARVGCPPWLKHQKTLVLQFGRNMAIPIPDLHVDETGIYGTLSFSQTPFICAIPWSAVFCLMGNGLRFDWPEDAPAVDTGRTLKNGWRVIDGGKR